jgi:hypothetical protein
MTRARPWTLAVLLALAVSPAQARTWDFRVLLDDRPIGYHRFALEGEGEARELKSTARFEVRLLVFSAYRYAHDATEKWRGDCIESLAARTDDDGKRSEASAAREGTRIVITGTAGRLSTADCVMTFAYWNDGILRQSRLLNAQTGDYTPIQVAALGEERIRVKGDMVAASRYRITGPAYPVDLWYAAGGAWVALQTSVKGGRQLRYELQ